MTTTTPSSSTWPILCVERRKQRKGKKKKRVSRKSPVPSSKCGSCQNRNRIASSENVFWCCRANNTPSLQEKSFCELRAYVLTLRIPPRCVGFPVCLAHESSALCEGSRRRRPRKCSERVSETCSRWRRLSIESVICQAVFGGVTQCRKVRASLRPFRADDSSSGTSRVFRDPWTNPSSDPQEAESP